MGSQTPSLLSGAGTGPYEQRPVCPHVGKPRQFSSPGPASAARKEENRTRAVVLDPGGLPTRTAALKVKAAPRTLLAPHTLPAWSSITVSEPLLPGVWGCHTLHPAREG